MKGVQAHRPVVTRRHPRYYQFIVLAILLIALFFLVLGYIAGTKKTAQNIMSLVQNESAEEMVSISIYNALESEAAVLRTQSAVNQAALIQLRDDLSARDSRIADLETNLSFFRSLMVSGKLAEGIGMQPIEIIDLGGGRNFEFRIVVQQQAKKHNLVKGTLTANIYGVRKGQFESHTFAALSQDLKKDVIPLRFRYFQKITGQLKLPEDFNPQGVDAVVRSSSPSRVTVQKKWPWKTTDQFLVLGE